MPELGPTNLRMTSIAGETLGFRWADFSSAYVTHANILTSISSIPTYIETSALMERSPTSSANLAEDRIFGVKLKPR